jgi:UDP-N-acetylmuramate: L-alanyl-gamma-D-glutamyl-meso-diaminopimelate ligase
MSVKRRLEHIGSFDGVEVYDDFAHHPTAIVETLSALRSRVGSDRILAVLEPRSNTMKQGIHAHRLKESLDKADRVYFFRPQELAWDTSSLADDSLRVYQDTGKIIDDLIADSRPGDNILIMSNGGFENLHKRLLSRLATSALSM